MVETEVVPSVPLYLKVAIEEDETSHSDDDGDRFVSGCIAKLVMIRSCRLLLGVLGRLYVAMMMVLGEDTTAFRSPPRRLVAVLLALTSVLTGYLSTDNNAPKAAADNTTTTTTKKRITQEEKEKPKDDGKKEEEEGDAEPTTAANRSMPVVANNSIGGGGVVEQTTTTTTTAPGTPSKDGKKEETTQEDDTEPAAAGSYPIASCSVKDHSDTLIALSSGPIQHMPYAHGGYFGVAPLFFKEPLWLQLLESLMPSAYKDLVQRKLLLLDNSNNMSTTASFQNLILWAENNPVVCAFGCWSNLTTTTTGDDKQQLLPTIEWDVFLDPALVRSVTLVLTVRANLLKAAGCSDLLERVPVYQTQLSLLLEEDERLASVRTSLKYLEGQLRRRVQALVDSMLVAHGSLSQLALEQTGLARAYNFSRIKHTKPTQGGGLSAREWMAVFATSLQHGYHQSSSSNVQIPDDLPTIADSVAKIEQTLITQHSTTSSSSGFSIVIDAKSRYVPPSIWACVVDALREAGVRMDGVATFAHEEVRGLNAMTTSAQTTRELLLFHAAGDVQRACHVVGAIRPGDCVYFNAGCLIEACNDRQQQPEATTPAASYKLRPFALYSREEVESSSSSSTLKAYKDRYKFSIGVYVQEFAIDEDAATLLVSHMNEQRNVYDLGFSWGGINGYSIRNQSAEASKSFPQDGYWSQRYLGTEWNYKLEPEAV